MKFSMKTTGKIDPAHEINLPLVQERLAAVARRRASEFATAMGNGLRQVAEDVSLTKEVAGNLSTSFTSVKEDAGSIQFAAEEQPPTLVAGATQTEVSVGVVPDPTPSGRDPEIVVRAFEFGSVALDVPATAFSQRVVAEQQHQADADLEEVAKALE